MNEIAIMHYEGGGSDKVYVAEIVQEEGGFNVRFRFGRRVPGEGYQIQGNQGGQKHNEPVSQEVAQATFEDLVNRQLGKGYRIVQRRGRDAEEAVSDGDQIVVKTGTKTKSGILPTLLVPIESEEKARQLCDNPSYCMQEKHDGERRMLVKESGVTVAGLNRKGEYVDYPIPIRQSACDIDRMSFVIDGEEVGETFYAFDLLHENGTDLKDESFEVRQWKLSNMFRSQTSIKVSRTAFKREDKHRLFDHVKASGGEGVVFKLVAAPYQVGRSKYGLKFKFTASATVRVIERNGTKRSVKVAVIGEDRTLQAVGSVTIPANYEIPEQYELVEVRYLYCYPNGGSLFQPTYFGPRDDKDEPDTYASLKFKRAFDPDSEYPDEDPAQADQQEAEEVSAEELTVQ